MTEKKIYLIPGLGADARMYGPQLRVLKNAVILEHMKPLKGENLAGYAKRLSAQIDTSQPFIIIGTSLGGIIAMELSRIIHPDKVIIISSVKHRGELPVWMRAMKHLKLHKLITGHNVIRFGNENVKRLVSRRHGREVANLVLEMQSSSDPEFVGWAINEVVNWEGPADHRKDVIHIHGTKDQLFPHLNIKDAIYIEGGSHVMGLAQAREVNKVLLKAIEDC